MKKVIIFMIFLIINTFVIHNGAVASEGEVAIGGFISQGYLKTDKNNYLADTEDGSFQFNEMGLYFKTVPVPNLRVGMQFFARDLGDVGNDEITITWAFAEYKPTEIIGLRAGMIKTPLGFYNDSRDMDMLRTFVFLPSSVYNEYFRDGSNNIKGGELFGNLNMGMAGMLQYQVLLGTPDIPIDSGTAKLYKEITGVLKEIDEIRVGFDSQNQVTWFTPIDGLKLKAFYVLTDFEMQGILGAPNPPLPAILDATRAEFYNLSIQYLWSNFIITAETYSNKNRVRVITSEATFLGPAGTLLVSSDTAQSQGYYFSLSYRMFEWLELGTYYSFYENDRELSGPANELEDIAFAMRFDINNNWLGKLEVHKMDGLFSVEPEENGDIDKDWFFFAAKMTYFF